MRTTVVRVVVAVIFAVAAWISWSESKLAASVADARQEIATFDYGHIDALAPRASVSDFLPGEQRRLQDDIRISKATVSYWLGRYDIIGDFTTDYDPDATVLLAVANAAYRDAQRDPATGPAAVQRLDGVLQAYASALKATRDRNSDADYNYEFVARARDQVARAHGTAARITAPPAGIVMGGDLPAGPTIHGTPGAPPPDAKTEEFQTIMPM
jgi:hypothetical protein